jgi:hypothetical protein
MTEAPESLKKCSRCKRVLPLDAFSPQRGSRDGLGWWCKPCKAAYRRAWMAAHPEKRAEYAGREGRT